MLEGDAKNGFTFLDFMASSGLFSADEMDEIVQLGYLNALFVLGRSIGFMGHIFDQFRLKQPMYRHPFDDILYMTEPDAENWDRDYTGRSNGSDSGEATETESQDARIAGP